MFDATTIPVLEQVVQFAQARHGVLAGNIANLDTPGYRTRDLSPAEFEKRLKEAVDAKHRSAEFVSPGIEPSQDDARLSEVSADLESILYHDQSNVSLEHQVTEIAKNQSQHNLALTIMRQQFQLLEAAIRERIA